MSPPNLPNRQCITFLTDFGVRDTYVAQMKGVALGIQSDLQLIDLTHEIPSQQVSRGAVVWNDSFESFPPNTIHVGVVDPGVGSERRLVAAEIGDHRFVCPDNGLLSVILKRSILRRVVTLDDPRWWRKNVSNTFHGRDILTPVAAAWSLGHDLTEFGSLATSPLITLPMAEVTKGRTFLKGVVVDIDHFGNIITSIESSDLPSNAAKMSFEIGSFQIDGICRCYADVAPGEPLALIGSAGRLEFAIRDGNAADEFQIECGRSVSVRWKELT